MCCLGGCDTRGAEGMIDKGLTKWHSKISDGLTSAFKLFVFGCYFLMIAHLPAWMVDFLMVSQDIYTEYFRTFAGILSLGAFVNSGVWLLNALVAWCILKIMERVTG